MKKILLLVGAGLVVLVGFSIARTARFGSGEPVIERVPEVAIREGVAGRLAGSLRLRTISYEDSAAFDADAFQSLHA
jgi:hypothetical protein